MPGDPRSLLAEQRAAQRSLKRRRRPVLAPPDPSLPIGTDTIPEIRHIVVLMMENHSYDSYLGMLRRGDGLPLGPDGRPSASNPDGKGNEVPATPRGDTSQEHGLPTQSWHASHVQWNAGKNDGFIYSSEALIKELHPPLPATGIGMQYWTARSCPSTTVSPAPSR